jgi:hypothetical protein
MVELGYLIPREVGSLLRAQAPFFGVTMKGELRKPRWMIPRDGMQATITLSARGEKGFE